MTLPPLVTVTQDDRDAAGELWLACGNDVPHENDGVSAGHLETMAYAFAEHRQSTTTEERLREALEGLLGWGQHDEGCATNGYPDHNKDCDCGLRQAERDARAALTEGQRS